MFFFHFFSAPPLSWSLTRKLYFVFISSLFWRLLKKIQKTQNESTHEFGSRCHSPLFRKLFSKPSHDPRVIVLVCAEPVFCRPLFFLHPSHDYYTPSSCFQGRSPRKTTPRSGSRFFNQPGPKIKLDGRPVKIHSHPYTPTMSTASPTIGLLLISPWDFISRPEILKRPALPKTTYYTFWILCLRSEFFTRASLFLKKCEHLKWHNQSFFSTATLPDCTFCNETPASSLFFSKNTTTTIDILEHEQIF